MVASTARPPVSQVISWDKAQQQLRPAAKKNNPTMLIATMAMILLAATGLWRAMHHAPARQMIQVMSAQRDIPAGTRIGITSVRFLDVPRQYTASDMITSLNDVSGRVTRTFIPAGEPIQSFMLFPGHDGLSVALETHERAITLSLDDDALVDHSIGPDDRVDLLVVSSKNSKKYTKTICQAVRVLMAVPKEQLLAHRAGSATNKITLAVTPDLAEAITEAQDAGKIRLVLRNRVSRVEQSLAGANQEDLLPAAASDTSPLIADQVMVPPPPVSAPPAPDQHTGPLQWMVEVISGNHKENYAVPEK